jgi:hypothetical protein
VAVTSATVLAVGVYTLTANFTPADTTDYTTNSAGIPFTVAAQSVFVVNSTGSVASFLDTGAVQSGATSGGGIGAAVDASGYVWSINTGAASLSKFTDVGALSSSYSGGGMSGATALAIDGLGKVWVVNSGSVSEFTNAGAAVSTTPVANAAGISTPASVTINAAGSLWIANSGNNTVTEVIGVAAPVTTPAVTAVTSATPGTRP